MSKLKQFLGLERRSVLTINNLIPGYTGGKDGVNVGSVFNDYAAMNLSTVFSCIDLISSSIAKLPIKIQDKSDNGKNNVTSHPVLTIFNTNTDSLMTAYDLKKYLVASMLLRGNGYAYIHRAADGLTPVAITYLEPDDVTVYYDKTRDLLYYQSYLVNGSKKIEPDDMIHIKAYSYNGVEGISVIGFANRSIKLAQNAEIAANNYFDSGMKAKGVLIPEGATLQGVQVEQIKNSWDDNTNSIQVLRTPMKFQQMSINANDSQLLQSREFSVDEIARWFHVPPALLSSTKGTFSSLEMLLQMFYGNCLSAHIASIESEFNKKLLRPSEQSKFSIYFDTNELLRAIKKDSAQYYQILVTSGILTPNEARADLGYAPIEGGDELRIAYSDAGQNALTPNNDNNKQEGQE